MGLCKVEEDAERLEVESSRAGFFFVGEMRGETMGGRGEVSPNRISEVWNGTKRLEVKSSCVGFICDEEMTGETRGVEVLERRKPSQAIRSSRLCGLFASGCRSQIPLSPQEPGEALDLSK